MKNLIEEILNTINENNVIDCDIYEIGNIQFLKTKNTIYIEINLEKEIKENKYERKSSIKY